MARLTGPLKERFHLIAADEELQAEPDYGKAGGFLSDEGNIPIHGRVLSPGESNAEVCFRYWQAINQETFEAVQRGESHVYFYASLKYFDFADQERELQFCYVCRRGEDSSLWKWVLAGPKEDNKHT